MKKIALVSAALLSGSVSLAAFGDTKPAGVSKSTETATEPNDVFQCTVDNVVTTKVTQVDCQKAGGKWSKGLNPTKPNVDKAVQDLDDSQTAPAVPSEK